MASDPRGFGWNLLMLEFFADLGVWNAGLRIVQVSLASTVN